VLGGFEVVGRQSMLRSLQLHKLVRYGELTVMARTGGVVARILYDTAVCIITRFIFAWPVLGMITCFGHDVANLWRCNPPVVVRDDALALDNLNTILFQVLSEILCCNNPTSELTDEADEGSIVS